MLPDLPTGTERAHDLSSVHQSKLGGRFVLLYPLSAGTATDADGLHPKSALARTATGRWTVNCRTARFKYF